MKYLLVALINLVYGILLLATLDKNAAGIYLVVFISAVLILLGLVGIVLWFWMKVLTPKSEDQTVILNNWFSLAKGVDILLIIGLIFRTFILQPFLVEGSSMEKNYHDQEFILVDRVSYYFSKPERGQVIIFKFPKNPSEDYIKRIIGVPGDTVKIQNGSVYVNNQLLNETYLSQDQKTVVYNNQNSQATTLAADEYFVLGDNRDNSSDSRMWGPVPKSDIIGRAWLVVYPFSYFGLVKNPTMPVSQSFWRSNFLTSLSWTASKFT